MHTLTIYIKKQCNVLICVTLGSKVTNVCVLHACVWIHVCVYICVEAKELKCRDYKYSPPLLAFSLSHSAGDRTQVLMFTWQTLYQLVLKWFLDVFLQWAYKILSLLICYFYRFHVSLRKLCSKKGRDFCICMCVWYMCICVHMCGHMDMRLCVSGGQRLMLGVFFDCCIYWGRVSGWRQSSLILLV